MGDNTEALQELHKAYELYSAANDAAANARADLDRAFKVAFPVGGSISWRIASKHYQGTVVGYNWDSTRVRVRNAATGGERNLYRSEVLHRTFSVQHG